MDWSTRSQRAWGRAVEMAVVTVVCLLGVLASAGTATAADPVLVAAGDIACPAGSTTDPGDCQQQATSNLALAANATAVALLGDNQYLSATLAEFDGAGAFNDTWGRAKTIIEPSPGNHEYDQSSAAAGYFSYFGAAAGPGNLGYYSYDLGAWHIVSLNSNCTDSSGCANVDQGQVTSAETQWLQGDLAAHPGRCTVAYWHHPLFTSIDPTFGPTSPGVKPLWDALYAAHADLVLNGHSHNYERFAQQTPTGTASSAGIREFIAGTGGRNLNTFGHPAANSQFRDSGDFGILMLTLHPGSYDWRFQGLNGTIVDSGSTACHSQPPVATTGTSTAVSASSAAIAGSVNPNGLATTYHFDYGTSTNYGSQAPAKPDPGAGSGTTDQPESANLTGLSPATTYHYRLEATNSAGTTFGSDQTFTTSANAPSVTSGSASNVGAAGATVAGTVNPGGAATTYHFDYGASTNYGSQAPAAPDPSAGFGTNDQSESATLTGLSPGTTYHYRLEATNAVGTTYGADQTLTTTGPTITTAPQGSWVGSSGASGYVLGGWYGGGGDVVWMPGVQVNVAQGSRYVWAANTSDARALQSPDKSVRNAATYYDPNEVQVQLSFSQAYSGNLELYAVDWDSHNRREAITVGNQSASLSGDFSQGAWITVPINQAAGSTLTIKVDRQAGWNAVLSGIFLGGGGTPPGPVSTPQGNWVGSSGASGYDLGGWYGGGGDVVWMPGVQLNVAHGSRYLWGANTSDARALQSPDKSVRNAATYYDPNEVQVQLSFSQAYSGNLELYAVDWDTHNRRETITVGNQSASLSGDFSQGAWITVPINQAAGSTLTIKVDRQAGWNAVLSGIFLGGGGTPPGPVSTPQGNWVGSYGVSGYDLAAWNGGQDVVSMPGAQLNVAQASRFVWARNTTDVRALQSADKSLRNATTYYDANEVQVQLTFSAAYSGNLELYAVDWDSLNRRETITVGNQSASLSGDFSQGAWITIPINQAAGSTLTIKVDRNGGANAVLSGIFLN